MPDATASRPRAGHRGKSPAHIICCAAGMPDAPGNYPKGRYLAWVHGWFVPCCQPAVATRYQTRPVALNVAARAAQAFPGARFEVFGFEGILS